MISLFRTMLLRPRRVPCPCCAGTGELTQAGDYEFEVRIFTCLACRGWGRLSRREARCVRLRILEEEP